MTAEEWIAAFASALGLAPPAPSTIEALLALASEAAHQSERTAAPLACYLAGVAGIDPVTATRMAADVAPPDIGPS
jgi:Domain of unknown function (DUF6457)